MITVGGYVFYVRFWSKAVIRYLAFPPNELNYEFLCM